MEHILPLDLGLRLAIAYSERPLKHTHFSSEYATCVSSWAQRKYCVQPVNIFSLTIIIKSNNYETASCKSEDEKANSYDTCQDEIISRQQILETFNQEAIIQGLNIP